MCNSECCTSICMSIAALLLVLSSVAANAADNPRYIMSVDTNGPGTHELLAGDYDKAIERASLPQFKNSLAAHLTVCSAQIGLGNYQEAELSCDAAVKLAKSSVVTARKAQGERDREGLAKAYSNRAILNRLLQRHQAAEQDFALALRQKRQQDTINHNRDVALVNTMTASTD